MSKTLWHTIKLEVSKEMVKKTKNDNSLSCALF